MFDIITVTMQFDPLEDRIIMDCSDKSKKTQRLWLTRRLLDKLIPRLTKEIEISSINKNSSQLEQLFAQEKALINQKKTQAVKLNKSSPSLLVTSVQVGKSNSEFKLIFIDDRILELEMIKKENTKNKAQFDLAISNLRQLLNAFFKIYKKATWDTEKFPNWIEENILKSEKKSLMN
tara:strand:- start:1002 stop:1532 length:531 start_codon:yes stop_codon:yes gene_type:complete